MEDGEFEFADNDFIYDVHEQGYMWWFFPVGLDDKPNVIQGSDGGDRQVVGSLEGAITHAIHTTLLNPLSS